MSEIGESFSEYRENRKEKKRNNIEYSTKLLSDNNINFHSNNGNIHLIITVDGDAIADFWPSTGKYKFRNESEINGRGVHNLIKSIKEKSMSGFEMREGQMFIFSNDKRENENQPSHTGNLKLNGKEMQVSCWVKDGKNGRFFSCKVQEKGAFSKNNSNNGNQQQQDDNGSDNNFDDDIPF